MRKNLIYKCTIRAVAEPKSSINSRHQRTQSNNHSNISELLDNLLRGYDNSVRPGFGGPPAMVEVDIMVRSMGPISEVDMVRFLFLTLFYSIFLLFLLFYFQSN